MMRLVNGIEIEIQRHGGTPTNVTTYKRGCSGSCTWFTLAEFDSFISQLQAARDEANAAEPACVREKA